MDGDAIRVVKCTSYIQLVDGPSTQAFPQKTSDRLSWQHPSVHT